MRSFFIALTRHDEEIASCEFFLFLTFFYCECIYSRIVMLTVVIMGVEGGSDFFSRRTQLILKARYPNDRQFRDDFQNVELSE